MCVTRGGLRVLLLVVVLVLQLLLVVLPASATPFQLMRADSAHAMLGWTRACSCCCPLPTPSRCCRRLLPPDGVNRAPTQRV